MNPLSKFINTIKSYFLYTPRDGSGQGQEVVDEVYDKELLLNVDHEVINVGAKLKELVDDANSLRVEISALSHQVESLKYLSVALKELQDYSKAQDAEIETIKAREFDASNEIKNLVEVTQSLSSDLGRLKLQVEELKVVPTKDLHYAASSD